MLSTIDNGRTYEVEYTSKDGNRYAYSAMRLKNDGYVIKKYLLINEGNLTKPEQQMMIINGNEYSTLNAKNQTVMKNWIRLQIESDEQKN